jgi:hypothetical protein
MVQQRKGLGWWVKQGVQESIVFENRGEGKGALACQPTICSSASSERVSGLLGFCYMQALLSFWIVLTAEAESQA